MALSRALQRATTRHADQQSDRLRNLPRAQFIATVSAVVAGGAADLNALVTVTWRDEPVVCAGYAASYTPVVGHRVVCDVINNQPVIAYRIIGSP